MHLHGLCCAVLLRAWQAAEHLLQCITISYVCASALSPQTHLTGCGKPAAPRAVALEAACFLCCMCVMPTALLCYPLAQAAEDLLHCFQTSVPCGLTCNDPDKPTMCLV